MLNGQAVTTRRFSADARLQQNTHLTYTYDSTMDDGHGSVIPQTDLNLALNRSFHNGVTASFFYRENENTLAHILTRGLGVGLQGSLSKATTLSLSYTKSMNGNIAGYDRADQLQLQLNQKLNASNFFSLSASWLTHDGKFYVLPLQRNDIMLNLQFSFIL